MATVLVPDREKALRVGYEANDWTRPVDYELYVKTTEGWDLQCIERDGQCIGTFYRHPAGEIHLAILRPWRKRWATKGLMRQILSAPRVSTRVVPGHDHMYDILHRWGFVPHRDGVWVREN